MSKSFVFLDTETSGLDPRANSILEIGWVITNEKLQNFIEPRSFVIDHGHGWGDVFHDLQTNSFVENMHRESGLLEAMKADEGLVQPFEAFDALYADLESLPKGDEIHLAGFSVSFDREFLKADRNFSTLFLESLDGGPQFHHRLLDLSAIKLMYGIAGIDLPVVENPTPHRALADALEALEFARTIKSDLTTLLVHV